MSYHDDGKDTFHLLKFPAAPKEVDKSRVYYEWLQLDSTLPVREFHLDLLSLVAKERGAFFQLASARKRDIK